MSGQNPPCDRGPGCAPASLVASELNRNCFCITLDRGAMAAAMKLASGDPDFFEAHIASRPHLFSSVPVFLPAADRDAMMEAVSAIEAAVRLPGYRDAAIARAPSIASHEFGTAGAFMGYDFHLAGGTPRLIEINTNAGGAFLNAFAARAQLACCRDVEHVMQGNPVADFDDAVMEMMLGEWRLQRGEGRPRCIAIVDDAPESQFLYPEFVLARRLFESRGIPSVIAGPGAFAFGRDGLTLDGRAVDMVYNRLVDFSLAEPGHAALRAAYEAGAAVVTPGPRTHALFADKRNLVTLSDGELLRSWGLPGDRIKALASVIPRAVEVTPENAAALWERRRTLFFKPVAGFGGKAVYRGDKLTRAVWESICAGGYIAQELAAPGERSVRVGGETLARKVDVRLYTWQGRLLLAAARLYQGQTTNFRTEGGGFAPVYFITNA